MQLFVDNFILLQDHSTCFGCCLHPSSRVHKILTTASGTGHIIIAATFFQRGQIQWPRWRKVAATIILPVPEAVVTVLCTPDNGCGQQPEHVEWSCSKIKFSANSCISLVYYNIYSYMLFSFKFRSLFSCCGAQCVHNIHLCNMRKLISNNNSTKYPFTKGLWQCLINYKIIQLQLIFRIH